MIESILVGCIGGLMNWVRGGNALGFIGKKFGKRIGDLFDAVDKILNDVVYATLFSILTVGLSLKAYAILHVSMLIGRAQSWGLYKGNLIKKRNQQRAESKSDGVDWINKLLGLDGIDETGWRWKNTLALSVIGTVWSTALAAGLLIVYSLVQAAAPSTMLPLAFSGAMMGPIVAASVEAAGLVFGQDEKGRAQGWWIGEALMGFWLWYVADSWGVI